MRVDTPQSQVLAEIEGNGSADHAELRDATGLSANQVAQALGSLLENRLVEDAGDNRFRPAQKEGGSVTTPRRDSGHDQLRAEEWARLRDLDPRAVPPEGSEMRTLVKRRTGPWGASPVRIVIEADLDEDAEVIARKWRELQKANNISKRPKVEHARRRMVLRDFAAEHGTETAAYDRWNTEHPEMKYSDRRNFSSAAKKALASQGSIVQEVWEFAGRPEVERLEAEDGSVSCRFPAA